MSFMEKQIEHGNWYEIDGTQGITAIPADMLGDINTADLKAFADYYDGEVWEVECVEGFGARMSAPGYLDCTDWTVFDSEAEAREHLEEMYGEES